MHFRGCHGTGTHRSCIGVGVNEDHWKTQEHNQFDWRLHSRRLVDGQIGWRNWSSPLPKTRKKKPSCKLEGTLFTMLRNLFVITLWVTLKMGHKNILCSLEPKSKSTFIQFCTCDCLNHSRYSEVIYYLTEEHCRSFHQ